MGPQSESGFSPYMEVKNQFSKIPLPALSAQTVVYGLVKQQLWQFMERDPVKYKESGLKFPNAYEATTPELRTSIATLAPDVINTADLMLEEIRKAPGLEGFGKSDLPINFDTSFALWQANYTLWLEVVHRQCVLYLDHLHTCARVQGREANKLEKLGMKDKAYIYDARKAEFYRKLINDAISLGCPEVIDVSADRNLATLGLILHSDDVYSNDKSHVPYKIVEDEIAELARALAIQKGKLASKGIDAPLFEQEAETEPRSQRLKREERERQREERDRLLDENEEE